MRKKGVEEGRKPGVGWGQMVGQGEARGGRGGERGKGLGELGGGAGEGHIHQVEWNLGSSVPRVRGVRLSWVKRGHIAIWMGLGTCCPVDVMGTHGGSPVSCPTHPDARPTPTDPVTPPTKLSVATCRTCVR